MVQTFEDADAFMPITAGLAMIASGVISYYPVIKSHFFEVWDDDRVSPRLDGEYYNLITDSGWSFPI